MFSTFFPFDIFPFRYFSLSTFFLSTFFFSTFFPSFFSTFFLFDIFPFDISIRFDNDSTSRNRIGFCRLARSRQIRSDPVSDLFTWVGRFHPLRASLLSTSLIIASSFTSLRLPISSKGSSSSH